MTKLLLCIAVILITGFGLYYYKGKESLSIIKKPHDPIKTQMIPSDEIRYIPIGDSYTIGAGIDPSRNYPSLLTTHLKEQGYNITLLANPAVSGYSTQDAIATELSVFEQLNPNFATILLGANDIAQGISSITFKNNLIVLFDRMLAKLGNKRLLVLTIPDFSITSYGKQNNYRGNIALAISERNNIIKQEAQSRGLKVVNLFELSQEMENDQTLILDDGLHPSAREYEKWEQKIFPVAVQVLTQ